MESNTLLWWEIQNDIQTNSSSQSLGEFLSKQSTNHFVKRSQIYYSTILWEPLEYQPDWALRGVWEFKLGQTKGHAK